MSIPYEFSSLGYRKRAIPTDGLVFYHPLNSITTIPIVGEELSLTRYTRTCRI